ncbi:tetratricopeptide repeat protein [Sinomicrobium sp. M5D2P17]
MRIKIFITAIFGLYFLYGGYGQQPAMAMESAEISTEDYSDEFQEHFFEALKQRGIENYDKAVDELLKCKKLKPDNDVVDYELGRNYKELKAYDQAETYLLAAVEKNPEIWYLDALFGVYEARGETDKAIEVGQRLAKSNGKYKENLIRIYTDTRRYEEALTLIKELDSRLGKSEEREQQKLWINTRLQKNISEPAKEPETTVSGETGEGNELEEIYRKIEGYKKLFNHREVLERATEALEIYPSQPKLYYDRAHALNRLKRHKEAITTLQTALDYLIDDTRLENDIYREFVIAYNSLGDDKKAREYTGKMKN